MNAQRKGVGDEWSGRPGTGERRLLSYTTTSLPPTSYSYGASTMGRRKIAIEPISVRVASVFWAFANPKLAVFIFGSCSEPSSLRVADFIPSLYA